MAKMLKMKEAARMLGIAEFTLYRKDNLYAVIPRIKNGKFIWFDADVLQKYIDDRFVGNTNNGKYPQVSGDKNVDNATIGKYPQVSASMPDSVLRSFKDLFMYWKSFSNLIQHEKHNENMVKAYKTRIKQYPHDEIKKAISNYSTILADPTYLCSYGWRLDIFLKQPNAMPVFLDESKPFENQCRVKVDPKTQPWTDPLAASRQREEDENREIMKKLDEMGIEFQ